MQECRAFSGGGQLFGEICMTHCLYCSYTGEIIWVHGHGQCPRCHTNIEPCCDGVFESERFEEAEAPADGASSLALTLSYLGAKNNKPS